MKISYILNTASCDPWTHGRSNLYRSADYSSRYDLVQEKVLPSILKQGFDEVIVAGIFEEGEGYQYVHVPPKYRDRRDALYQRELGARYATGDVLVFGHDDHALGEAFIGFLRHWIHGFSTGVTDLDGLDVLEKKPWDLLIPRRVHSITGEDMNNGKDQNYMGGHVLVIKRWLWAEVPWTTLDTTWWDVSMTRIWREAGGKLVWADDLIHCDVEAGEDER